MACTAARAARLAISVLLLAAPAFARQSHDGTPATAASPVDPERAERPTAIAVRADGPIAVDGRLDEPAWTSAPQITAFVQAQPKAGYPASETTIVRVVYDDQRIYIGAECLDSDPTRLVVPSLEQDFESTDSDIFGVTLDTFHDRRNAFMFLINPRGAVKDTQNADDSRSENGAWEGVIDLKTRVHDRGWSVELAIPFTTVRFDPRRDPQTWGINFLRRVRRKNEDAYWAPLDRRDRVHRMSKAGTLEGLQGLRPGRNLTIKPFALASSTTGAQRLPSNRRTDFDGGIDAKYGLTPRLTLDLTWRTDFSQVEVDQEQVNLTRFSLFFPEKRDFFMENAGSFQLGDVSDSYRTGSSLQDFTLFHSRRIGLTDNGRVIPIVGGGRVTGRVAGLELGVLDMQTEAVPGNPAENFAVLRVRRAVFGRSDLGAMFINRQVTDADAQGREAYNRTYGVDLNLRPVRALAINSYAALTDSPTQASDRSAARVSAGWRDRFWNVSAFVKHVGEGFDPGVGFVRRRGIREGYGTFGVHARPKLPFVQEINPYVEVDYIATSASVLETRQSTAAVSTQLRDGSRIELRADDSFERVFEAFDLAPGAVVMPGDYAFREGTASYNSSAGRRLSGKVALTGGSFYGGEKTTLTGSALWRPSPHLSFDASINHNDITLDGESFGVDVYGARMKVGFSTRLFASAFVQLNTAADQRVVNVRLNYLHGPLSHLYVTYTDRRDTRASGLLLERALTIKLNKLLAF